jgi:hypothetical protein
MTGATPLELAVVPGSYEAPLVLRRSPAETSEGDASRKHRRGGSYAPAASGRLLGIPVRRG